MFLVLINTGLTMFILLRMLTPPDMNILLRLTVCFLVSTQIVSTLFCMTLFANLSFTFFIICWMLMNLIFLVLYRKKLSLRPSRLPRINSFHLLILFLVLLGNLRFIAFSTRWGHWDAWAIWNLHAKFIFTGEF